jgi:Ni,Fe-hydrogenase maturation factor
MKNKTIHIFGNPLLDFDNLPLRLAPKLQKIFPEIDFVIADPSENIEPINGEMIIIDTVEGIKSAQGGPASGGKVVIINDLKKIQTARIYSLHDFDLAFNLKLLQKIGKLKRVKIFGVPMNGDEEEILEQLEYLITTSL